MSENNNSELDKKQIARSAAYPSITIQEAIDFVAQIKKSFPTSGFRREDVISVLKKTAIHRDIAAAVQYGLVERNNDNYKLSTRVQSILTFVTEDEKRGAIIDCLKSPKLYIELIEKFKGHAIPPDQQLRAILTRFHNITEAAAPQAAEIFIENALFAGVLDEHRILLGETITLNNAEPIASKNSDTNSSQINSIDARIPSNPKPPLLLEEINGSVDLKIHLTEKKVAHLIYPDNVNERDIQILKLQLEALALTL